MDVGDLTDYVGQPPFTSDRIYGRTPAGVVMGLAWTSMGGNALYIEAAMVEAGDGKGGIRTTGARCGGRRLPGGRSVSGHPCSEHARTPCPRVRSACHANNKKDGLRGNEQRQPRDYGMHPCEIIFA